MMKIINHKMGCLNSKSSPPPSPNRRKKEVLLTIPNTSVHLTRDGEATELAKGTFTILKITDEDIPLATIVKVGHHLYWPLTKDEPVIKIDKSHYLFTIPDQDGSFLNYGVTFVEDDGNVLEPLDEFLKEHACFSSTVKKKKGSSNYEVDWKDYAPKIDEYNGLLAKAIGQGTGEIVKGIFTLSNVYTSQVQKAADKIQPAAAKKTSQTNRSNIEEEAKKNSSGINPGLKSVRKISETTENMSQALLNGVLSMSGFVTAPIVNSNAGKAFFGMLPGEVLLASLAAVTTVLEAVETAERKALAATSGFVSGAVSKRFGESAGEATEDMFATAGHAVGTAWNVIKLRKALNPSASLKSAALKNALLTKN